MVLLLEDSVEGLERDLVVLAAFGVIEDLVLGLFEELFLEKLGLLL